MSTWSNLDTEWRRFRPAPYSLSPKALTLPLVRHIAAGGSATGSQTTIGEVLKEVLEDKTVTVEPPVPLLPLTIHTTKGQVTVAGAAFNVHLLETLLALYLKAHANPFDAMWFWYDRDSATDTPHDMYDFFVVHNGRIVQESVSFADYRDSGFAPSVFDEPLDSDETSGGFDSDKAWVAARLRYWYRRFYEETETGQLMVLRPDEPILHHYPQGANARLPYQGRHSDGKLMGTQPCPDGRASAQLETIQAKLRTIQFTVVSLAGVVLLWMVLGK